MLAADDEVFAAFAVGQWDRLVRAAFLLSGSAGDAEDLAQATLLNCYLKWERVQGAENQVAYVSTMLLNAFRQSRRSRWRSLERSAAELPDRGGIDPEMDSYESRSLLQAALQELSEGHRQVVVLRHYMQLSEREAAEVLGVPPGTVKSRLSRALAQMSSNPSVQALVKETPHE